MYWKSRYYSFSLPTEVCPSPKNSLTSTLTAPPSTVAIAGLQSIMETWSIDISIPGQRSTAIPTVKMRLTLLKPFLSIMLTESHQATLHTIWSGLPLYRSVTGDKPQVQFNLCFKSYSEQEQPEPCTAHGLVEGSLKFTSRLLSRKDNSYHSSTTTSELHRSKLLIILVHWSIILPQNNKTQTMMYTDTSLSELSYQY